MQHWYDDVYLYIQFDKFCLLEHMELSNTCSLFNRELLARTNPFFYAVARASSQIVAAVTTLVAFVILAFSRILYPHFMGINRFDLAHKQLHLFRDCNYILSDFLFPHVKPIVRYVLARRTLSLLGIAPRFGNKRSLDRHRIWQLQMESRKGSGS